MTHLARRERLALCETFEAVGPHAPTLCSPWDTAELAAHLVIRERRPDLAPGILIGALAGRLEVAQREYAAKPWPALVDLVRTGPPLWSPTRLAQVDNVVNLLEFFVHHEDVLRAEASGPQREVDERLQRALWAALGRAAKLYFRRSRAGVVLLSPGHGRHTAKGPTDLGTVVVQGNPSELVLTAFGRGQVADIEPQGSPEAVAALLASTLGP